MPSHQIEDAEAVREIVIGAEPCGVEAPDQKRPTELENLSLASILIGCYLLLSTWYRRSYLSYEGQADSLPSWLPLAIQSDCDHLAWPLAYLHMKFFLFLVMMVALLAGLSLFFRPPDKKFLWMTGLIWLLTASLPCLEVRLITPTSVTFILISAFVLVGGLGPVAFRWSLTVFGALVVLGLKQLVLGLLCLPVLAALWWPKTTRHATILAGALSIAAGLWVNQEYPLLLGMWTLVMGIHSTPTTLKDWKKLAVLTLLLLPLAPKVSQLIIPHGGLSKVEIEYRFHKDQQTRSAKIVLSPSGRSGTRVSLLDLESNESPVRRLRQGTDLLISRSWITGINLANTHTQTFYRVLENKIKQSSPGWSSQATVSKFDNSGEVVREELP